MWTYDHYIGATERGRRIVWLRAVAKCKYSDAAAITQVSRAMVAAAAEMTDSATAPTVGGAPAVYVVDGRLAVTIRLLLYAGVTTVVSGGWVPGWQVSTRCSD